ncbi:MAG: RiPP maturation radical SAM C-methyltransferase [Synergistaceae bacterium]|jgi:ribosomal peptide maturation radical SAM protein 1|nr:RiPP maturation radical SAM C-methyltransferase [Synergistaceae bacterium]
MICLINMPFASLVNPPIGAGLISALLKDAGMEAASLHFSADFARKVGYEKYEALAKYGSQVEAGVCEWLFAGLAWGWDAAREDAALDGLFACRDSGFDMDWLRRIRREIVPGFMEECAARLGSISDLAVVGFSSLSLLFPSLALGRMLHETMPDVKLVYGGCAFYGEMGLEVFDKVEWIDAVSTSEADDVVAEAFRRLIAGEPLDGLRGMAHRDRATGKIYKTPGGCAPAEAFDNGIVPDFDDYFAGLEEHGMTRFYKDNPQLFHIPFETSRGCWWRDKCQCTFCGINRDGPYRLKSTENVLSVLKEYRRKYGVSSFAATDANLSTDVFNTFLPELENAFSKPEGGVRLFSCVKASTNRSEVKALAEAGFWALQPGIESLSDHVLKLMRKGVSAIQNIFFLKCARQYGISLFWFVLLGSGGETTEDCREIAALLPRLIHLPPPHEIGFVQIYKYSEYWRNSGRYLDEMKPARQYEALFPAEFDLARVAYVFDAKWKGDRESLEEGWKSIREEVEKWKGRWEREDKPTLCVTDGGSSIRDTRSGKVVKILLEPNEAAIYAMLDDIAPEASLLERASKICASETAKGILDSFVENGLALKYGGQYLGLALRNEFAI